MPSVNLPIASAKPSKDSPVPSATFDNAIKSFSDVAKLNNLNVFVAFTTSSKDCGMLFIVLFNSWNCALASLMFPPKDTDRLDNVFSYCLPTLGISLKAPITPLITEK